MDDSSIIPPSHGALIDSTSTKTNGRGATKLNDLTAKCQSGQRYAVGFDEFSG